MKMTHKEIEEALDQPGFALDNLPKAEQRLLVDTVYALVARAAECRYPLCQPEAEQAKIADEVARAFFTGDPAPVCCWKCANGGPVMQMVLCPTCGNKRCPKASNHELACTGSNEPGQPGSVY